MQFLKKKSKRKSFNKALYVIWDRNNLSNYRTKDIKQGLYS